MRMEGEGERGETRVEGGGVVAGWLNSFYYSNSFLGCVAALSNSIKGC